MCNKNIKRDCKFYKNNPFFRGCIILKEQICRNSNCIFYKKRDKDETKNVKPIHRNRSFRKSTKEYRN